MTGLAIDRFHHRNQACDCVSVFTDFCAGLDAKQRKMDLRVRDPSSSFPVDVTESCRVERVGWLETVTSLRVALLLLTRPRTSPTSECGILDTMHGDREYGMPNQPG